MSTVSTSIKIDPTLKRESQELFEKLGLNFSSAISLFLRQAVREQAIPFRICVVPNVETREAIEETKRGIGLSRGFSSVEELMEDLNADD